MTVTYLKKAAKTPESESGNARAVVEEMLARIEAQGEEAVRFYAQELDKWSGPIVVTPEEVDQRTRDLAPALKRDIEFATDRVRRFALAQRNSVREFSIEMSPG